MYTLVVGSSRQNARRCNVLYADSKKLTESLDVETMFELFESSLKLFVAEMAPERVFVHAGVIGWHGKAILIPGRSYSGKITLVSELVRAGASYYSDEYAFAR